MRWCLHYTKSNSFYLFLHENMRTYTYIKICIYIYLCINIYEYSTKRDLFHPVFVTCKWRTGWFWRPDADGYIHIRYTLNVCTLTRKIREKWLIIYLYTISYMWCMFVLFFVTTINRCEKRNKIFSSFSSNINICICDDHIFRILTYIQ